MRTYSKEFREEAVRLSDEIGVKKASAQLGIPYYTLAEWRQKRKSKAAKEKAEPSEQEKNDRIAQLEKENKELKEANEILKDALGFFAKDRKK